MKRDSPLICHESCISFGMIVTLLVWMAHKFSSSKSQTLKASTDSCIANYEVDLKRSMSRPRNRVYLSLAGLPLQDVGMASCG
jgi:hypothetical protein